MMAQGTNVRFSNKSLLCRSGVEWTRWTELSSFEWRRLHSHLLLLLLLLLLTLCCWRCRVHRTEALLVLSQLPLGSIRVDWHRVCIVLTHASLRSSLILFSCQVVSLAYCSPACFTFQWGIPCCIFLCMYLRENYSFLMKRFDRHMKAMDASWSWAATGPSQPCVRST